MSDQLDNDLKNRIREVFDNYQDESADAGWLLLREKFPEEKKRRLLGWWWYSAAAVLLLYLGIWFLFPPTKQLVAVDGKKTIHKNGTLPVDHAQQITVTKPAAISKLEQGKMGIVKNGNGLSNKDRQQAQFSAVKPTYATAPLGINGNTAITTLSIAKTIRPTANNEAVSAVSPIPVAELPTQNVAALTQPLKPIAPVTSPPEAVAIVTGAQQNIAKIKQPGLKNSLTVDSIKAGNTNSTQQVAENTTAKAAQPQQVAALQTVVAKPKEDAMLTLIKADDARQQAMFKKTAKKDDAKSNRARMLSIYAATYFNYAKGSENQVNVGAGFTSDFRITNNLKFTTGLSIAQNQLNYSNGNLPTQINNKVAVAAASSDVARTNILSSSLLSIQASPTAKNYNASLVGLDLPLNLKYQFNPQKNDTYISAGISSGTYINETYRSTYSYGGGNNSLANSATAFAITNSAVTNQTQESTTNQHFSTFDFAKTLNLSFGIGYPLGKNRLIIEPFLKYPLGGLGAQNISFGSSGINLKLNFRTSKK